MQLFTLDGIMVIQVIGKFSVYYRTYIYYHYHNSLWFVGILTEIYAVFTHPSCFFITSSSTFSSLYLSLSMMFLRIPYRTYVPCMLILLAYVGGHICLAFKPTERKVERCENMIIIVIVWRSCTNILKFIRSSITPRSGRIKQVCLLTVEQEQD
jgi:hypothetical protein